jgi:hypothetical protein
VNGPLTIEKEMGITHAEFFRVIRRALAGRPHVIEGNRVRIEDGPCRLDITLSAEEERRIALVALPVTRVRLAFTGYGPAETAEALAAFDRWFQRGGG